jgi:DNA-binding CsgD family transcriptional regulator
MTPLPPATEEPGARAPAALNRRDLELLRRLADGQSTGQIAAAMSISRNTARTRIRRLQRKLGAPGRASLVDVAKDLGLL